ncbi:MAG: putative CRISPR-associated protein [Thermoanaerobaculum sp.]|nr:putative CRISPR-associated protein [Thermoanaerobaculum sp.]MDW7967746.1 putative CRISPR-associated protein [Thermoanaerobaculum sp.]
MRNVLVATVGTSVLTNFREMRAAKSFEAWVETQPEDERATLANHRAALMEAAQDLERRRFEQAALVLACFSAIPRVLGAEVASVEALLREPPYQQLSQVLLLTSDTEEGTNAGRFLSHYLRLRFELTTKARKVSELRDDQPGLFRTAGLRQLVVELARAVRECGAHKMVIDATGGYKAQVAVAVAFGQVFHIPVVYRFERFAEIIEIPPLPMALDWDFLQTHRDLLEQSPISRAVLEAHFGSQLTEANPEFARFAVALAGPDNQGNFALSPSGQLLLEALRARKGTGKG